MAPTLEKRVASPAHFNIELRPENHAANHAHAPRNTRIRTGRRRRRRSACRQTGLASRPRQALWLEGAGTQGRSRRRRPADGVSLGDVAGAGAQALSRRRCRRQCRPSRPRSQSPRSPQPRSQRARKRNPQAVRLIVAGGVIVAVAVPSLGVLAVRRFPMPQFAAAERRTGNLTIDTRPAGSQVLIDGEGRGVTPLTLALEPGAHTITVRSGERRARGAADDCGRRRSLAVLRDEGRRAGGCRRQPVDCDRPARRARRRRRQAARHFADHRGRPRGRAAQGHGDQRRRLGRTHGGSRRRQHDLGDVFAAEGVGPDGGMAFDFRRRSTSRCWRTATSSAPAARAASCSPPAATTSSSPTARLGYQEARRIDVTRGADRRRSASTRRKRRSA